MGVSEWLRKQTARKKLLLGTAAVVVLIFVLIALLGGRGVARSESYKDARGKAAGLHATITYDAACDKRPCKQAFDFNVYVLRENGQQAAIARPDQEGSVRLALPEGNYIMLIGKQFGKDRLFPQEPVALKSGKELELKLRYKE